MIWINAVIVASLCGAGVLLMRQLMRPEKIFPPLLMVDNWCYAPTNTDRYGRWVDLGGPTLNRQTKEHSATLVCLGCAFPSPHCECMENLDRSKRFTPSPAAFSVSENGTGYSGTLHLRDTTVTPLAPAERERLHKRKTNA